ncbi:MAG: hypothetical protein QXP98_01640 [Thermoproteus sp.]
MIGLYADRLIRTELPLLVPLCEVSAPNVIPYVGEDLACLTKALRTAYRAVALRTRNKVLVRLVEEMRPDVMVLVDGLKVARRRVAPLLRPGDGVRGYYIVRNKAELRLLDERLVEGIFLDVNAFDPKWVEEIAGGRLKCGRCNKCDVVELLLCDAYREIEIL